MSIFDFLKRKKEVEKAKENKPSFAKTTEGQGKKYAEKEGKISDVPVARQPRILDGKAIGTKSKKEVKGFSYEVIKEPHISEKSTNLNQNDKYVFKVYSHTNKPEIKKSVEGIYGVNVLSVNIIKIPKKKRRIGKTEGFRKGYSKAVVTIKEGQKIEIF